VLNPSVCLYLIEVPCPESARRPSLDSSALLFLTQPSDELLTEESKSVSLWVDSVLENTH